MRDWLANFIHGLSQNLTFPAGGDGSTGGNGAESEGKAGILMDHPLVVGVARQVFGLLQSPLLHPTKGVADAR